MATLSQEPKLVVYNIEFDLLGMLRKVFVSHIRATVRLGAASDAVRLSCCIVWRC